MNTQRNKFSRTDLMTTLGMIIRIVESASGIDVHRSVAHTMFEIILAHWHLINLKTDKKFIQVCQDKANQATAFKKYVDTFEELLNPPPPPLRRSARLRARKAPK